MSLQKSPVAIQKQNKNIPKTDEEEENESRRERERERERGREREGERDLRWDNVVVVAVVLEESPNGYFDCWRCFVWGMCPLALGQSTAGIW